MPNIRDISQQQIAELKTRKDYDPGKGLIVETAYYALMQKYGPEAEFDDKLENEFNEQKAELENSSFKDELLNDAFGDFQDENKKTPEGFYNDFKMAKDTYGKLQAMAQAKNYAGIVDTMEDVFRESSKGENNPEIFACKGFITELTYAPKPEAAPEAAPEPFDPEAEPPLGPEIGEDKKETAKGVAKALAEKITKRAIEGMGIEEEFAGKIENGEIDEMRLIKDDKSTVEDVSHGLMFYQTENGQSLSALNFTFETVTLGMQEKGTARNTIDGMPAFDYFYAQVDDLMAKELKEKYPEKAKTVLEKENGAGLRDMRMINGNSFGKHGDIVIRTDPAKEGESYFRAVPAMHTEIMNMSDEELLRKEYEIQESKRLDDEGKARFMKVKKGIPALITELDSQPMAEQIRKMKQTLPEDQLKDDLHSEPYKSYIGMRNELENLTKFGKGGEYVVDGEIGARDSIKAKNDNYNSNTARMALNRLEDYAESYAKRDPAFAYKVKSYIWEQKHIHRDYLGNKLRDDEYLSSIAAEKEHRGIADKSYSDKEKVREAEEKVNSKLTSANAMYQAGKLTFRGKAQYDAVGAELAKLNQKLEKLRKFDALRTKKTFTEETEERYVNLLKSIKKSAARLKDADKKYFEHKKQDGQWGPNNPNKNAEKRVNAVREAEELADLVKTMAVKKLDMVKHQQELKRQKENEQLEADLKELAEMDFFKDNGMIDLDEVVTGKERNREPAKQEPVKQEPEEKLPEAEIIGSGDEVGSVADYQRKIKAVLDKGQPRNEDAFDDAKTAVKFAFADIIAARSIWKGSEGKNAVKLAEEAADKAKEAGGNRLAAYQKSFKGYMQLENKRIAVSNQLLDDDKTFKYMFDKVNNWNDLKKLASFGLTKEGRGAVMKYTDAVNELKAKGENVKDITGSQFGKDKNTDMTFKHN